MENKPPSENEILAKINAVSEPGEEIEEKDVEPDKDSPEEEPEKVEDEVEVGEDKEDADTGKAEEPDGEGYTIDDEEGDVEEPPAPKADEPTPVDTSSLSPEQKYILDNLQAVTVRGRIGDGGLQEFKVYDPAQLPVGFQYDDQREMSVANKAFSMLEQRAERLQQEYRGQETTKATQEFKKREDDADRQDIGALQRNGDLPKFKTAPNSKDFDADPATVLIQEVLDFKESQNNKYLEEYNAGRPYKHIGFEEALTMFQRQNPDKTNTEQKAEDDARKGIAKRASKGRGSDNNPNPDRPTIHSGMTSRNLDALIEARTVDW